MRRAALWLLVVTWAATLDGSTPGRRVLPRAAAGVEQDVLRHVGVRIERDLAPGETHVYRLPLNAGEYAHVSIDQHRVNLVERIGPLSGRWIDNLGVPGRQTSSGVDRLVIVAEQTGDVEIQLRDMAGLAGRYAIGLTARGEVTPIERVRFEAQNAVALALGPDPRRAASPDMLRQIEQTLPRWREIDDPVGEITALLTLGLSHWTGDRRQGRPYFLEALAVARRTGDPWSEREALNDLGETATALGEPRQAADYLTRGLALTTQLDSGNRGGLALLLHNLAVAYRDAGEFQAALRYAHEALALWHENGESAGQAYARHNIGFVHHLLGDWQTAQENLTEALALWRSEPAHHIGVAMALTTLGTVSASHGDHRVALAHFREAIDLWRKAPDIAGEGRATYRLAASLAALGDWPAAIAAYERALSLFTTAGARLQQAEAWRGLGEARYAIGQRAQSVEHLRAALASHRELDDRAGEAAALFALARVARDEGEWESARVQIEQALALLEHVRTTVASQELRASFLASKRDYHEFYVDLLMQLHGRAPGAGHAAAALAASERGRARSLLETLTTRGVDIRAGAPSGLLAREQALERDITAKTAMLGRLVAGPHAAAQAVAIRSELQAIVSAHQDVQARLRAESPRYAALTQPAAFDLAAVRQRILDDDTALLEYALGAERSYLWVVTRKSFAVHVLPKRAEIEAAARAAYDLMTASERRQVWGQAARASARLSKLVLGPVADQIGYRRLLVVADGALHYVPFAALPHPKGRDPLIATHEVVTLPSAAALAALREDTGGRPTAAKRVAVLADPVLEPSDPRVGDRPALAQQAPIDANLRRSANESGFQTFPRLKYTREEADAIADIAGAGNVWYSVDFDANRATALSSKLSDYRIVHFATHGLINSQHPELSGLVLSLVDPSGAAQDGFVRLNDIYNLKLGAQLVVLSACRTALGKDVRGEGLIGLTRGFMYAGAPRVVASLWDVRDRATAELMKRFYKGMLTGGLTPAAALRAAQVSMWKEPRWQSPFYWAAFNLYGDWQ